MEQVTRLNWNAEPVIERFGSMDIRPLASVVVLNRNGAGWLPKCFASIKSQTIIGQIETILVDNDSSDDSVAVGRKWLECFPSAAIVRNPIGLGYCGGNNNGTRAVRGKYALYINNDAWMEPDCMEKLVAELERTGAAAASPWVLNYADNSHQDIGFFGFDIFGLPSPSKPITKSQEIFISGGCSYFIEVEVFKKIGMFDAEFFMYSDEVDLSWRVWIAGYKIVGIPEARVHHRGAAGVNPAGGSKHIEFRTDDEKRFLTNRNCLLTLLKNGQHIIALAVIPQLLLLAVETAVGCLLLRRLSFARNTLGAAIKDCWRLRHHVVAERRLIAGFRKHGDFWMLRFFCLKLNRSYEIQRLFRFGRPRVDD
jgi:GT2 family glycosyltransferase